MAEKNENGKGLDDILGEFCKVLEKKVDSLKEDAPKNVAYIEEILTEIPDLKHTAKEMAELLVKVSESYLTEKSKEILDKANEKYLGKVPKHDLIYKCVETYKASGKSTSDVYDDVIKSINHLRSKEIIDAENGHVILPLRYGGEK